jgi:hypothetical protein
LKRYSRNLLVVSFATAAALMPVLFWLNEQGRYPLHDDVPLNYLVAISLYDGFALAGLLVLTRFLVRDGDFLKRLMGFLAIFMVACFVRILIADSTPDPFFVIASVIWEAGRAVCIAFAVAFLAHAMMVRWLPSTMLRIRDITPVLYEDRTKGAHTKRIAHAKRTRWIFEMGSRKYLNTTRLHMRTTEPLGFSWRDWGEATLWTALGLVALSIYAEAYPRVEERFDLIFTAIISAHILSIIPILVLPMYPVKSLGPVIPTDGGEFEVAVGFHVNLTRWVKIAFFPIIAVGLLFRTLPWENAVELMQALLITIPTAAITCLVYMECFRKRTVAEVHKGIAERETVDADSYGDEPWRQGSLLEGTEIVTADFYLE